MSSENNISIPPSQDSRDENQPSGGRKTSSIRPQEQPLNCPRCDSPNTKFCYYNNYSLSQPRHFCKTCRRYWTKGGALRNVPIGGGCRKSKKMKSASPRFSGDSRGSSSSSDQLGGVKFFQGFSPAMDFQLGGLSLPGLQPSMGGIYTQYSSTFGDISTATSAPVAATTVPSPRFTLDPSGNQISLMGYNNNLLAHQYASASSGSTGAVQDMGAMNVHANIASSIESLSSMNQDLHWKLQQQRLAMLCGGERNSQKESIPSSSNPMESQTQKPQALVFQNLEISRQQACGVGDNARKQDSSMPTECFFGNSNSYAPMNQIPESNDGHNNTSTNNWNGVQAWGDLQQYSSLP